MVLEHKFGFMREHMEISTDSGVIPIYVNMDIIANKYKIDICAKERPITILHDQDWKYSEDQLDEAKAKFFEIVSELKNKRFSIKPITYTIDVDVEEYISDKILVEYGLK